MRQRPLSNELCTQLRGNIQEIRTLSQDSYRQDIKSACQDCGQTYGGSHGFRHNFAQNSYAKHIQGGMSDAEALGAVSSELEHHRTDITLVYLR